MIKYLLSLITITVFASCSLYSQQLLRQSLSCFGSSYASDGILIRQTVGQSSNTISYSSSSGGLRQGFQQPINLSGQNINPEFNIEISVYPNPIINEFSFVISGDDGQFNYKISDMIGNLVCSNRVKTNEEKSISCSSWSTGIYFISIYSSKKLLSVKKLVKTQY